MAIRTINEENFTQFISTIEMIKSDFLAVNGVPLEYLEDELFRTKWIPENSDDVDWYSQYNHKVIYLIDDTDYGKVCYVLSGDLESYDHDLLFCSPDSWDNRFKIMKQSLPNLQNWLLLTRISVCQYKNQRVALSLFEFFVFDFRRLRLCIHSQKHAEMEWRTFAKFRIAAKLPLYQLFA